MQFGSAANLDKSLKFVLQHHVDSSHFDLPKVFEGRLQLQLYVAGPASDTTVGLLAPCRRRQGLGGTFCRTPEFGGPLVGGDGVKAARDGDTVIPGKALGRYGRWPNETYVFFLFKIDSLEVGTSVFDVRSVRHENQLRGRGFVSVSFGKTVMTPKMV